MDRTRGAWWIARVLALLALALPVAVATGPPAGAVEPPVGTVHDFGRGIGGPRGIVTGPDGNLWFTNQASDGIGRVTPSGEVTLFSAPDVEDPEVIAVGPDGNLWFTNAPAHGPATLGVITTEGDVRHRPVGGLGNLTGVAAGSDGNLWFTGSLGAIGRLAGDDTLTTFTDATIEDPTGLVLGADGNLWFLNRSSRGVASIGRITPSGAVTAYDDPALTGASVLAKGPDGNVWFTAGAGAVGRITSEGTVTVFTDTDIPGHGPIVAGGDGNLWLIADDTIVTITPAGSATALLTLPPGDRTSVTTGPDGNVWFADRTGDAVGRVTPAGVVTTFAGNGVRVPSGIARGPDDAFWFANGQSIGRVSADGAVSTFTAAGVDATNDLAVGADGNLWFTTGGSSIGRITPAGKITLFEDPGILLPHEIVRGLDDALWFTSSGNHSIGRITTAGVVTMFPVTGAVGVASITVGLDGNLWFTTADRIGRLTPGGAVTLFAPTATGPIGPIATGPDRNLWVPIGAAFVRFTTAGAQTTFPNPAGPVSAIAAGLDGALWFTTPMWGFDNGGAVGRLTMEGEVTIFEDLVLRGAAGIAAAPDGRMWVTNLGSRAIATVTTADVPGRPHDVTAVAGADDPGVPDDVAVSWTGPTANGGAPVTGYVVTAEPGGQMCVWPGGPLTCRVGGLEIGTTYRFTVTATNDHGTSEPSERSVPVTLTPFADVPYAAPFAADIAWLAGRGIATGYGDGLFHPTAPVSRQATAAFLYRWSGSPSGAAPTCSVAPFPDVPVGSPYCGEIAWLAQQQVTRGYADGTFRPTAPVSREAMVWFLYRIAGEPVIPAPWPSADFVDVPLDSPLCVPLHWLVLHGVASGYRSAVVSFHPGDPVSRQAMAAFLHRLDGVVHA